jgi:Fe2+ transport system protein FeoA
MKLSELPLFQRGIIHGFSAQLPELHRQRLRELGFCEGLSVELVRPIPFGGPNVFRVADAIFSVDPLVSENVLIETESP